MVRIAYCLLVHKNPDQVKRLLQAIRHPGDRYYVNVFRARRRSARVPWEAAFTECRDMSVEVAYRYSSGWGNFNLVAATLDAMRFFQRTEYDLFVNLSGQCYPIKPAEGIRMPHEGGARTHMEYEGYPSEAFTHGIDPISGRSYRKSELERFTHWNYRIALREFGVVLKVPRWHKRLPEGLRPFRGSQWFYMKREHVNYVLEYLDRHPAVVRFFRRSSVPDDVFFQTVLLNSPHFSEVTNSWTRYVVFSGGRPKILTIDDLPQLLAAPYDYARKFDLTVDPAVFDELDRRLHERQGTISSNPSTGSS